MRTLLTGFGPFGNVVDNPTQRLVAHFAQAGAPGHDLTTHILPVSFRRASAEVQRMLTTGTFDVVLMLGVAVGTPALRVETTARNRPVSRAADCDNEHADACPLWPSAPDEYRTPVRWAELLADLHGRGIDAIGSDDAGGYVCNCAYYAALHTVAQHTLATRCVFVHVPADALACAGDPVGPCVPLERQVVAVRAVLAWLAGPD